MLMVAHCAVDTSNVSNYLGVIESILCSEVYLLVHFFLLFSIVLALVHTGSIWKYWNMQPPADNSKAVRFLDRVECFTDKHQGWKDLFAAQNSKIVRAVSELFGEEAVLWKEKMNFKKPGSAGFAPHQDAQVSRLFLHSTG